MNFGRNLLLAWASLFFPIVPAAHGAGIDLHQHGLTGSWYEARTSGQGFLLEVFPDLFSPGKGFVHGSWFTYDNVVGGAEHQRWYSLSGPVVSGQTDVSMTIHQNTGGNFNAPPITTAHPVGTATLSFDTCTSGQLVYNFTDGSGRASTIPLTRLTPNVTCSDASERPWDFSFTFSGHWYDPAMPGQGITMELNRVSRMVFLGWQTYAPSGAGAGPAGQRWYTGQGVLPSPLFAGPSSVSIPLQLYETTGGLFDDAAAIPTTVVVGTAGLTFVNCAQAKLRFNFTGGSSTGASGTITLRQIGPSSGAGCWDY